MPCWCHVLVVVQTAFLCLLCHIFNDIVNIARIGRALNTSELHLADAVTIIFVFMKKYKMSRGHSKIDVKYKNNTTKKKNTKNKKQIRIKCAHTRVCG